MVQSIVSSHSLFFAVTSFYYCQPTHDPSIPSLPQSCSSTHSSYHTQLPLFFHLLPAHQFSPSLLSSHVSYSPPSFPPVFSSLLSSPLLTLPLFIPLPISSPLRQYPCNSTPHSRHQPSSDPPHTSYLFHSHNRYHT